METCSILLSLSYRPPGTHACLQTNLILKIVELVSDACPPIPRSPIGKKMRQWTISLVTTTMQNWSAKPSLKRAQLAIVCFPVSFKYDLNFRQHFHHSPEGAERAKNSFYPQPPLKCTLPKTEVSAMSAYIVYLKIYNYTFFSFTSRHSWRSPRIFLSPGNTSAHLGFGKVPESERSLAISQSPEKAQAGQPGSLLFKIKEISVFWTLPNSKVTASTV